MYPGLPNGVSEENMSDRMKWFIPLRRHIDQPFYKLIARIGRFGSNDYPLDLKPVAGSNAYTAEFNALRSGKLFLYVNDSVLPWFAPAQIAYHNNRGKAAVTVERWESGGGWLPLEGRR
jgi:hypothetical protein